MQVGAIYDKVIKLPIKDLDQFPPDMSGRGTFFIPKESNESNWQ